jgi:WD40 repeat protein
VTARFSADGRRVLTASADGSARRWHITDDPDVLRGHDAGIEHASFAPDGRTRRHRQHGRHRPRVAPRRPPPTLLRGHREGSSVPPPSAPTAPASPPPAATASPACGPSARPVPTLLATLPADGEREPALVALAWHPRGDLLAFAGDDGRVHLVHTTDRPVRTDILPAPPATWPSPSTPPATA